jgi:hypothetical protein
MSWKTLEPSVIHSEFDSLEKKQKKPKGPRGRFGHSSVWLSKYDSGQAASEPKLSSTQRKDKSSNHNEKFQLSSDDLVLPPDAPKAEGGIMFTFGGRLSGGVCTNEVRGICMFQKYSLYFFNVFKYLFPPSYDCNDTLPPSCFCLPDLF